MLYEVITEFVDQVAVGNEHVAGTQRGYDVFAVIRPVFIGVGHVGVGLLVFTGPEIAAGRMEVGVGNQPEIPAFAQQGVPQAADGGREVTDATVGAAAIGVGTVATTRITSYNVCYTKLLRLSQASLP